MLSFPGFFQTSFLALALIIIYKFVYVPYMRLRFYKKQGLQTEFFPLIGSFIINVLMSLRKHGDVLYYYKDLALKKPQQKVTVANFGPTPCVILLDPALKKELAFHHECYELGNFFGEYGKVFSIGLVGVNGNEWKKQRKIIAQSFHFEFLKDNMPMIVDITKKFLDDLSHKNIEKIPILLEVEKLAGEIIGKVFFSENLENYTIKGRSVTAHLMDTLTKVGQVLMTPGHLIFGPKYVEKSPFKSHKELVEDIRLIVSTCQKIIDDRRNSPNQKPKDLVWYLLESQKNALEEDRLSDEVIIGNYVVFIGAGTGTTSQVVGMTLYALSQHPEILAKLKDEIREVYDKESLLSMDTLNKMNWLTAIIKESLRMYFPGGMGTNMRTAIKDHNLGDIEIKKGTMVGASFLHGAFDTTYFENPTEYNPQRWIERPNVSESYAFTPFWAGPRNCIGQHLAMIEAKILVCEFVKKFEFEMIKDYKLKMGIKRGYAPVDDLPMNLTVRTDNL